VVNPLTTPKTGGIKGFESPGAEYTQSSLDLDSLLIEHPSATYFGLAEGDSLMGAGIFNGDLLIVSRALKPKQGDIIVANLNGEFVCKIFNIAQRTLEVTAPNTKPHRIAEDDVFEIEGVVIRSVRLHKPLKETFSVRPG
jgi:DNA polymerase V